MDRLRAGNPIALLQSDFLYPNTDKYSCNIGVFYYGFCFKIPAGGGGGGGGTQTYATFVMGVSSSGSLSNGDLTFSTNTGTWNSVQASQGKSSGKWVFEAVYDPVYYSGIGLVQSGATGWANSYLGRTFGGIILIQNQGILNGGGFTVAGSQPTTAINTPVMFAIDADAGTAQVIYGGGATLVWTWTPGTVIYPAVSVYGPGAGRFVTMNFGATAFTNPVPTGYNAGWYE